MTTSPDRTAAAAASRHQRRARRGSISLALGLVLGGAAAPPVAAGVAAPLPADLGGRPDDQADGRYIVRLRADAAGGDLSTAEARREVEGETGLDASEVLGGDQPLALVELTPSEAAALARSPEVVAVEPDQPIYPATAQRTPWGLDRLDQRTLPLDGQHRRDTTGAGVTIYVVDSGLRADHEDFAGRVASGFTTVHDGRGTDDCGGHGTHVAGIAAGARHGVAPGATIVPVRIFGCDGPASTWDLLVALDWIRDHRGDRPAVVNMSMGGGPSAALDDAVARLVAGGLPVVVAAGNGVNGVGVDACGGSPAREPRVLTVGATTSRDSRASYSNHGSCLDLFAPGSSVPSAGIASPTAEVSMSGTSMATPHVAGALARLLEANPGASPGRLEQLLETAATSGVVGDAGAGSPNLLLHLPSPTPTGAPQGTPGPGYWMLRRDGALHAFGWAAPLAGAAGAAVSFDAAPGGGLWLLRSDGTVEARGAATDFGSVRPGRLAAGEVVASISAVPDGTGYWVFTDRGRALSFGSAPLLGDLAHLRLNRPIVASVATPTGRGYYLVASDGGVFAFGDAAFHGSMGASRLNEPVVGVAPAPDGSGYWLVAADGGVFAFGVPFRGSVPGVLGPGQRLNQPVIGGLAYGDGYVMVAADGGAFVFSTARFLGSLGSVQLPAPVVGLTVTR